MYAPTASPAIVFCLADVRGTAARIWRCPGWLVVSCQQRWVRTLVRLSYIYIYRYSCRVLFTVTGYLGGKVQELQSNETSAGLEIHSRSCTQAARQNSFQRSPSTLQERATRRVLALSGGKGPDQTRPRAAPPLVARRIEDGFYMFSPSFLARSAQESRTLRV